MQRKAETSAIRTVCFVTGTRAEFGLMESTLRAIAAHPRLRLQIVATGMHLDPAHGKTIRQIRQAGWKIDATVPWKPAGSNLGMLARETGLATARLAAAFEKLKPDIVLVVGDRVEAFAAASAGHLSGKIVAHVHGGDRALGQVDDALRHAITKLSHVHFAATKESAERILKLGEDKWRVFRVGSPWIDGIREAATSRMHIWPNTLVTANRRFALFLLHPTEADDEWEYRQAQMLLETCLEIDFESVALIYPNNDPGSAGISRALEECRDLRVVRQSRRHHISRPDFLGLLRDAAVLVGNSSSGIIEAASFGTPVLDIGPRQAGRERGENVTTVPFNQRAIRQALTRIRNNGRPRRYPCANIYGKGDTARRIAVLLATIELSDELRRKLIAY
jgi:GDP/UDP-N,N'-diacetylbacillosamine 2-epimerase (hydrolysing)